ncbi:hypothetical protein HZA85_03555 [Candidatus Uhrbacteria bacterium]|nr:hypothetical protein [Candidatus Uhrbacteria bacterium]
MGFAKRVISSFLLASTLAFPQGLFAQSLPDQPLDSFDPNFIISDQDMLDTASTKKDDLALLLSRGSLAQYFGPDVNGITRSAVDIIWNAAQTFGINPRFLLVLLQREQSLVEDPQPSQDQFDWAMGYGVCDDCAKSDPRLLKFKGFGKQVYYAAQRIREAFLADLETRGYTETGVGPGREAIIDQTLVVPVNHATAVLYSYTPHLHGNANFARIWQRWFNSTFLSGALLQDQGTGGIWLIQNSKRRPITSRTAFFSRFNPDQVISTSSQTINQYDLGAPIRFPNFSLLRSPHGTVYLIDGDTRRGFKSQEALRALGFSSDEIVDVPWDDLNVYTEGTPIDVASVYPQGVLLQDKSTGGVFFVQDGLKHPIMSREILQTQFANRVIVTVASSHIATYTTGDPVLFPDGTLVAALDSPDVFVVENGMRRHITDEATFASYGWKWSQVVWTNERSVLLEPLGKDVTTALRADELTIATP